AIGSTIAFGVIGILNFVAVKKYTGTKFDLKLAVWKPLLSGIAMSIIVLIIYYPLNGLIGNSLSTVLAVGAGAAVYGIMLLKTRAIEADEIKLLPKGEKLEKLLRKFKLI
ncbi:MAG: polysaccharide biosynthesis C-terminal domain-containing protein, partial [Bacillota bacterium]